MRERARVQIRPTTVHQDGTHRLRDLERAWVWSQRGLLEGGAARLVSLRKGGSLYRLAGWQRCHRCAWSTDDARFYS